MLPYVMATSRQSNSLHSHLGPQHNLADQGLYVSLTELQSHTDQASPGLTRMGEVGLTLALESHQDWEYHSSPVFQHPEEGVACCGLSHRLSGTG